MATSDFTTKVCTKCGAEYPATTEYFHKTGDRLHSHCKVCRCAYGARYRVEHPEEARAPDARYLAKHRDEKRAYHRAWYAEHYEEQRVYRAENREAYKAATHRRRARKRELPDTLIAAEWHQSLDYFGNKCAYCGKTEDFWTIIVPDHYIALKDPRENNPGNIAANIVPACHARPGIPVGTPCCNQSKGNRDPVEWLEQRFGKRKAREILKRIEAYFEWVKGKRS